ncbi:hypothetical protein IKL64_00925 [bacterium]|nr:hypothetical protein [bacterium]
MKLLEIKNNLVKLSYSETETPILGRFIVLVTPEKSYVAQFVNLKSDTVNNFAIAKLLFTFSSEGVVDNYDGSIPSINSEVSFLPANELLNLLPIETPIKIGNLSQQQDMLSLDVSVFERNFTVFVEKDSHKTTFISNCIRQLFQMKEKSVVIDTCNLFEDYNKIVFGKDFKLPLNSKMIDYIFEYELSEVDAPTKAVVQDIFYAVQQYIQTLDFEFLPIDNFVDVVASQYKEMQMPELALLKNKLLKYRDANVFANTKDEVLALKEKLNEKNCSIIDLKNIHESLQKEVLGFIHSTLESFEKYIYLFVPLTDDNSDKKLLKQFVNNNHIFTTVLVSGSYKYAEELKQHAQNMLLFAPQSVNHDFAAYNTFLSKLNNDECIAFGKLTQGIPFIVDMSDLELDLTRDDVLGDRYQFVPAYDPNIELVRVDEFGTQIPVKNVQPELKGEVEPEDEAVEVEETPVQEVSEIPEIPQAPIELVEEPVMELPELPIPEDVIDEVIEEVQESVAPEVVEEKSAIVKPVANLLAAVTEATEVDEVFEESDLSVEELTPEEDLPELTDISEDDFGSDAFEEPPLMEDSLSEDDLDFIEDTQMAIDEPPMANDIVEPFGEYSEVPPTEDVPVYPADSEPDESIGDFAQGDSVTHPRYGRGVVEKIIKYGNKTLCSITFENVGRRLLDPSISELVKL